MSGFRAVKPGPDEYPSFMTEYVSRVPAGDVVEILKAQTAKTMALLRGLPESMGDHSYAPGKWTIRQIVGHLSDAERVFSYRALRFSRADAAPLAGFDENAYVDAAPFTRVSLSDLIDELEHLRAATIHLFTNLDEDSFTRAGEANGKRTSVRALAHVITGHEHHHVDVLRARYLGATTMTATGS